MDHEKDSDELLSLMVTNAVAEIRHANDRQEMLNHHDCIAITERNKSVRWIPKKNIIKVTASGNYIVVHLMEEGKVRELIACRGLCHHEPVFREAGLLRLGRSLMVNPGYCMQLESGSQSVRLIDGSCEHIPRGKIRQVRDKITRAFSKQ